MELGYIYYLFTIAVGITLLIIGIASVIKIYKGSKIPFAYKMTAFTCANGLTFLLRGSIGISPYGKGI